MSFFVTTDFSSLALPAEQLSNLADLGYTTMTPIQAKALPLILQGSDVLAKAKTGDTTAQSSLSGARTSYLSEAQGYYGSNADYASIFNSVIGDMNSLSLGAPTTTDIESQQIVVERLTDATNSQVNLSKEQVEALKKIDAILAQQQENTEAQLVQNGAAYTDILAVQREIDKRLLSVESTNRQAALA